ncbi:molybdopterin-guanine dinucleotide biosynthesis protein A [Bhargavaea beijingensis]|uniref:Molybdopterin-guanine dinucleotide biosynthesis protein A n=1 Tax=Bhargavaea beijingensis TaxID=426756 RepID=A0A1G6XG51_9BACL|nr:molybdenum cofactor guanylyltransferase [Bhargavaea beijingensis]SDD76176.1 molybdopterin-guanine dinucleotide biosynthesis protein A [Bhargavaea beijingensis]
MTTGIVLAGGLSRRFGSPKAFAERDGRLFWELAHDALLDGGCDHVIISARPEHLGRYGGADAITDHPEVAGAGPLAGIFTAMKLRQSDEFAVLPCDMPGIGPMEVRKLIALADEDADVTAVRTKDQPIPLFSVWNGALADLIGEALARGERGVMPFLASVETEWIDARELNPDLSVFSNMNRPNEH